MSDQAHARSRGGFPHGACVSDLFLLELSRIERAAMAAIAARTQREQLGTAFQPDPDEAVR